MPLQHVTMHFLKLLTCLQEQILLVLVVEVTCNGVEVVSLPVACCCYILVVLLVNVGAAFVVVDIAPGHYVVVALQGGG